MCAALTLGPFDSRLPGSTSWLLPMDAIVQAASVAIQPPSHSSPSPHCAPPAALPMPEAGAGSGGPGNNIDAWIAAINSVQARQSSDASEAQELGSHAAQALHVGEKRPRELAPHELDLMQQGLPPQGLSCCTGCWKCSCCGAFGTTRDAESGVRNKVGPRRLPLRLGRELRRPHRVAARHANTNAHPVHRWGHKLAPDLELPRLQLREGLQRFDVFDPLAQLRLQQKWRRVDWPVASPLLGVAGPTGARPSAHSLGKAERTRAAAFCVNWARWQWLATTPVEGTWGQ